jgi:hypothetical protein
MAKNADKVKVPKKVAGIKVPKALRKSGALDALVSSSIGREILAGAIVAAAGAAASALRKHGPSVDDVGRAGKAVAGAGADAASATGDMTRTAASALAGVVADAAQALLPGSQSSPKKKIRSAERGGQRRAKDSGAAAAS